MKRYNKNNNDGGLELQFSKWLRGQEAIYIKDGEGHRRGFISPRGFEIPIYDVYTLVNREYYNMFSSIKTNKHIIGRIDIIFRHSSQLYCGEIKYSKKENVGRCQDFYDALKVIGYCTYYNWQNDVWEGFESAKPAVIIPKHSINLSVKIIANRLHVRLFQIEKEKEGYKITLVAGY